MTHDERSEVQTGKKLTAGEMFLPAPQFLAALFEKSKARNRDFHPRLGKISAKKRSQNFRTEDFAGPRFGLESLDCANVQREQADRG